MNGRLNRFLRVFFFPLLLTEVYLAQLHFPGLFEYGALWSDHPRWWQYFTNGFLSGNPVHLGINIFGLWVVCTRFASQVRLSFLLIYFILFSAAASCLYRIFCMPAHATLVGASGGVFSLLGFLSWFLRRTRVEFFAMSSFCPPVLPVMGITLIAEFFIARYWIAVLAWQLHLIAFGFSMLCALLVHAAYAVTCRLSAREFRSGPLYSVFAWIFTGLHTIKQKLITAPQPLRADGTGSGAVI